jgi:hypothetical protein
VLPLPANTHLSALQQQQQQQQQDEGGVLDRDEEGALLVNRFMQTSSPDVYSAGDCCRYDSSRPVTARGACWNSNSSSSSSSLHKAEEDEEEDEDEDEEGGENWHQMRLWSQARVMGIYAAQCIFAHASLPPASSLSRAHNESFHGGNAAMRVFAHVTRFFGFKVVLLGRFRAQGFSKDVQAEVGNACADGLRAAVDAGADEALLSSHSCSSQPGLEVWARLTPSLSYVKAVVFRGRVIGAILVGDTDLEEVFENLILNGIDVGAHGVGLLDPHMDLEGYFD